MMHKSVLLDTSFFIRFLKVGDPLFKKADDYYRYFVQKGITMKISTISIAEYCTGGNKDELPFKNLQILPFNYNHSIQAGEFAKIIFNNKGNLSLNSRNIIPNDTKLFAQADVENDIDLYLSSDAESIKVYNVLKEQAGVRFQFVNLHTTPYNEAFGVLNFS